MLFGVFFYRKDLAKCWPLFTASVHLEIKC